MDKQTILERFRERHNIETLNPMQQLMATTDATRLILLSPTGSGKPRLSPSVCSALSARRKVCFRLL